MKKQAKIMFYKIQDYIKQLSKNYKQANIYKDNSYKLPLSDAFFCAEDIIRNKKFYKSIKDVINIQKKQTDKIVCVDAGAGTGLLGLYALVLGVDEVVFIEHNIHTMQVCKEVIEHFGFANKSIFINEDATKVNLSKNRDILISETISTDFVTEDFHKIINHLIKRKSPNSNIIPQGFELVFKNGKNTKKRVFCSEDGFAKQKISLKDMGKETTMDMNIKLYEENVINCGEAMSLGNQRVLDVINEEIVLFE